MSAIKLNIPAKNKLATFIDKDSFRYAMDHIQIKGDKDGVWACATNGKILGLLHLGAKPDNWIEGAEYLFCGLAWKKAFQGGSAKVEGILTLDGPMVVFIRGDTQTIVKLSEGQFPKYDSILSSTPSKGLGAYAPSLLCDCLTFMAAIDGVGHITTHTDSPKAGALTIRSGHTKSLAVVMPVTIKKEKK